MKVINWIVKTDIGTTRVENQDRAVVYDKTKNSVAILCDGMGGHKGGSFAAEATVNTFGKYINRLKPSEADNWFADTLDHSIKEMHKISVDLNDASLFDMGTTVVAAFVNDDEVRVYNIGDSRCYYYNGSLFQVTVDQNLTNYLIRQEHIPRETAKNVYGGKTLTSSLGPRKRAELEIFEFKLDSASRFLVLTSDGIHDYISKPAFETILNKKDLTLDEKAELIISQGIKGNSTDNLTILILEFGNE